MGSHQRLRSDHARIAGRFAVLVASVALLLPAQAVWLAPAASAATCPSGSDSVGSGYCQVIFDASASWTIPANVSSVDVVAVGAGGGGGGNQDPRSSLPGAGGGGGGGQVTQATYQAVTPGASATITVGTGGIGGPNGPGYGTAGGTSSFIAGGVSVSAAGGSPGAGGSWGAPYPGGSGYGGASGAGYAGGEPKLFAGGDPPTWQTYFGGGGGGSSAAGGNAGEISGGNGGAGTIPSAGLFAGYSTAYAGGGGGGSAGTGGSGSYATSPGLGAAGGGAGNASTTSPGGAASANTGSGGGGTASFTNGTGGAGGSGLVIVRFLAPGGNWSQSITFTSAAPGNAVYNGTYTPTATATSGLPVSFAIDGTTSSVCSISGGVVTFTGVGTCTIDANQAGGEGGTYKAAAQVQQSFSVGKASQWVGWTSAPPTHAVVGGTWNATGFSSSGLPVTFVVQSGSTSVCSINPTTTVVTFIANGYCAITVTQAGNTYYEPASPVLQSFTVSATAQGQTITFTTDAPTDATVGGPTYTPAASATSGLTVVLTIDATASTVCAIDGSGVVSFLAAGPCVIDANQAGDATYNAAPLVQQTFTVAGTSPGSTPTGSDVAVTPASTGGTSPVTLTFDAVTSAGITSLTTVTTPPAPVPAGYQVGSATFFDLETTAIYSGSITVCYSYTGITPAPTNLLHDESGAWVDITQLPIDTTDQMICGTTASLSPFALLTVLQSQTITFTSTAPTNATVGGSGYTPVAASTSGLTVALTIDASAATVCSIDGQGVVAFKGAGNCVIDANQAGDANYNAAAQAQQSFAVAAAGSVPCPTGTIAVGSGICQATFTSSTSWTVPDGVSSVDVLAVGGGGGGGATEWGTSGGGGGGQVVVSTGRTVTVGSVVNVTVGAGGAGGAYWGGGGYGEGSAGVSSSFANPDVSVTAAGGAVGGNGCMRNFVGDLYGQGSTTCGFGGTSGSAKVGGSAWWYRFDPPENCTEAGGGGGGDAAVGGNGTSADRGGNGGAGTVPTAGLFSGQTTAYGGGGGGGGGNGGGGTGTAGGGNGGIFSKGQGSANTGGGGGGSWNDGGGAGGSGVVIVRFVSPYPPTVTTGTATSITASWAAASGEVVSEGMASLTERGIVYAPTATNPNPTIGGTGTTKVADTGIGTGTFSVDLSGLNGSTSYSFAAYATNTYGTAYGAVATFTTSVGKTDQTISFAALSDTTYGDAPFAVSATASSGLPVSFSVGVSDQCTISGSTVTLTGAGSCTVTATQDGDANHSPAPAVSRTFTVNPAKLTITASSATVTYGDPAPAITPSYTGLVNGDSAPATLPICSTTYTKGAEVTGSPYDTSCKDAAAPNYSISYVDGTVTVNPAKLTITASSATVTYGDPAPAITPSYTGLVNGDSAPATLPICSTTYTKGAEVTGSPYDTSCKDAAAPNYSISYVDGTVTVNPAKLTITASSATVTYGDPAPAITPSYTGLVNGDSAPATLPICSTTYTKGAEVTGSPYDTSCKDAAAPNYSISYVDGTVTVNPAKLTITGDDKTVQYSDKLPSLTYTVSGYVNSEILSTSDVTGAPSLSTTGVTLSDGNVESGPGTYAINVAKGTLASTNYVFAFTSGTLTVTQEDARAYYSGNALFWGTSASTSSATVTLMATIQDITAVTGDPAYDAYKGDIRNARVTFVNRETGVALTGCSTLTVALVSSTDAKVGTVTCSTTLTIGSSGGSWYTIGIVVTGYYADNASSEDTVVDVAAPITSYFITGGGFLAEASSAGQYAADPGTKSNFGFNVKFNKGATNLQGNVNIIVRRGGHTYQIKSNSLTSLGEKPSPCSKATATSPCTANFVSKASLQDITNPSKPVPLGGNLTLQMSMTDYGIATKDTIGFTLYNGSTLLFSSNWSGTKTVEQTLGGGNLSVR